MSLRDLVLFCAGANFALLLVHAPALNWFGITASAVGLLGGVLFFVSHSAAKEAA